MNEQLNTGGSKGEGGKIYIAKIKLSLIRENTSSKPIVINGPDDVASLDFIREEIISSDRENFVCLHLSIKHSVLSYEIVSVGSLNCSVVHPRETFKGALLANAAAVILAHNHPSGSPEPSPEDVKVTKRLVEAGDILGVQILDHMVFGDTGFVSFKERGLM